MPYSYRLSYRLNQTLCWEYPRTRKDADCRVRELHRDGVFSTLERTKYSAEGSVLCVERL